VPGRPVTATFGSACAYKTVAVITMRRRLPPRRRSLTSLALLVLGGAAFLATAASQPAEHRVRRRLCAVGKQPLVLSGGVLVDGTGAPPLPDAVVVIRGERISAVGRIGEVELPSAATVIDVRGARILPGVINAHVHSGYREERLEAWAHEGVTTVRCLAGPRDYALVDQLGRNPSLARVVAAGPFVTVPGGYPIVPWGSTNVVTVVGAEQARAAVNQLIDEGADVIKIAIESGADFGQSIPTLSLAEATAVVETAHARGVPVAAHVTTSPDLPRALDAGVDDIAHMVVDVPSTELITRVVRENVVWVPTLELWHYVGYNHQPRAIANLSRFLAAGGTVALGTDFNGYDAPFQLGMPVLEMELMQQAGMSPMQIIVAATRNAALVSNRLTDLGTVEPGKIADLVVVRGDPLQDIHAMADVRLVVRSGVVIRNDGFE
jgi:imidazolonepropionase-like amidohydrolase